jgi:NtrC-family two-component system sensor histidine kinase KinB
MLSLNQRIILGFLLLVGLVAAMGVFTALSLGHVAAALDRTAPASVLARRAVEVAAAAILLALTIAAIFIPAILRPLRQAARSARAIGQGMLDQRVSWSSNDDLGDIATEINRMAVRLRDLRETESGRKQMEHQLSDAVVQSIFEPVIVTDARGQVIKLNQAASHLLGEAASDRLALASTPGGQKILGAVRDAVSMQRAVAHEGEAALLPMRIGQAERSYRLRTTPMRDADGRLLGAVSVLEDVTELQDLDRYKTRFISVASQRLRGPLQSLSLGLYSLARGFAGELRPLQADLLHGAQQDAEKLNDLMTDLIDVSELDTGRREIRTERLRPIDILRDAAYRIRDEAQKKEVEIQINAFADLPPVQADRRAMRSIMDNLLSNAVRYTPSHGSVYLEAEEHRDWVQFFVRDTGRGIESERLPRIFGRFIATHDGKDVRAAGGGGRPPSGRPEGTGLGLALVRRLIERQQGQVSVESRMGHGTTFSFTLPIAAAQPTRRPTEEG